MHSTDYVTTTPMTALQVFEKAAELLDIRVLDNVVVGSPCVSFAERGLI